MALTGNENEASDLTAEAFAKALRNFGSYDPSRPFESWAYKITQNIHFDRKRRLKTKPTVSLDEKNDAQDNDATLGDRLADRSKRPDEELSQAEMRDMVQRALDQIPETFREPLALCDLMDISYEQIADMLKLPVGTVRSRIFRARQIFKKAMDPYIRDGGRIWTANKILN